MVFEATCTIAASPEAIWGILIDAPRYRAWDSGMQIWGTIAEGEKIRVGTETGRLAEAVTDNSSVKVSDVRPPEGMTWTGGMPLGLLKGVRTFTLEPEGKGLTRFTMREEFRGPLVGIAKKMPGAGPTTFDRFAAGLKARAEAWPP